ncbi:MAG: DUF3037 domain-containing protein [Pedobacter sp.]|nr:DUF3037 domain-containing protein [Pedobacter sp.]
MQEHHLFEYAVIRWVPQVEREEFINIGVILYCARHKSLNMIYHLDNSRLAAFNPLFDLQELELHLSAFQNICSGSNRGGPIAELDAVSRFRWLTAIRSTTIQTSRVHPGFCFSSMDTLTKLHQQLVLLT